MNEAKTVPSEATYAENQARLARVLDALMRLGDTPASEAEECNERMRIEHYERQARR